jgi:hypothetical protein
VRDLVPVFNLLAAHPWALAICLPLCVLAIRSPALVRALVDAYVTIRKSNVEIAEKQRLSDQRIKQQIEKRERKSEGKKK